MRVLLLSILILMSVPVASSANPGGIEAIARAFDLNEREGMLRYYGLSVRSKGVVERYIEGGSEYSLVVGAFMRSRLLDPSGEIGDRFDRNFPLAQTETYVGNKIPRGQVYGFKSAWIKVGQSTALCFFEADEFGKFPRLSVGQSVEFRGAILSAFVENNEPFVVMMCR
ncbi:hypothetical protein [Mameliella sp.]|uniref:hypothetical protein n=1 Tax=Mameliella sp. TaxID=1924940 RepID=UPI003B500C71